MAPHVTSPSPPSPSRFSFTQPRPRPAKSAEEVEKIRLRNRRREWLGRNPKYLDNLEHEFADPLLYDALVRRYQSAAERQNDAKTKGYSRVLEGDLMRGEAKLAKMAAEHRSSTGEDVGERTESHEKSIAGTETQKEAFESLDLDPPQDREEALERWKGFLRDRFVRGEDGDFDYNPVDEDEDFDILERRDREEEWFDNEDPNWASDGDGGGIKQERMLDGETGIQDF